MRAYVVRQGDHLMSIAARYGCDAEEVWNHPDNRELREQRGDGSVLAPGDVIYLPEPQGVDLQLTARTTNRYRATVAMTHLRLRLSSGGVQTLANEPYRVQGLAEPIEGESDGDGWVTLDVPAHTRELLLELPRREEAMVVEVGNLDPVERDSGLRARLLHLGYLIPMELVHEIGSRAQSGEERDAEITQALRDFQRARGLEETGEVDDDTRNALIEAHGS